MLTRMLTRRSPKACASTFSFAGYHDLAPTSTVAGTPLGNVSLKASPFLQSLSDAIRSAPETIKAERPAHISVASYFLLPSQPPPVIDMSSKSEKALRREKFEHAFTVIREELMEHFKQQGMPDDAAEWYRRVSAEVFLTHPQVSVCQLYFSVLFFWRHRISTTMFQVANLTEGCPWWIPRRS